MVQHSIITMHGHLGRQEGQRVANDGQEDTPADQGHGHLGHPGGHEGHHVAADGQANMFCRNLPPGQASFVQYTPKHSNTAIHSCKAQWSLALWS